MSPPDGEVLYRTPEVGAPSAALRETLEAIWKTKPGLLGWIGTVDHKEIGIRYMVTAFVMLALGGIEALVIRLQLAGPNLKHAIHTERSGAKDVGALPAQATEETTRLVEHSSLAAIKAQPPRGKSLLPDGHRVRHSSRSHQSGEAPKTTR